MTRTRLFGRFELLMEVSHGGMATLYLARLRGPEEFEKLVAIKKIHDHLSQEPEFIAMFLDEARIAARIQHPNVATIFDLGKEEDGHFIAMEYVHGQNLRELLRETVRRNDELGWEYAVRVVADAAAGLHAAHQLKDADGRLLNVVHRDVSPQNILISYEGHTKVVDFGIAYAVEKMGHTTAGTLKGKAAYMSPEQADGEKLDRRSDIFSLGIVLFESVCMKRLFRRSNHSATLDSVRRADIPSPREIRPDIPEQLENIIKQALARDPADRFSTAEELAESLEQLLISEGKSVTPARLGKLCQKLFHDRKKHKDIQIRRALENKGSEVIQSIGTDWSTGTSIEMSSRETMGSLPQRSSGSGPYILAAALVLVIGLAAGGYLLRDRLFPSSEPRNGPAGRQPSGQAADRVGQTGADEKGSARDGAAHENARPRQAKTVSLRVRIRPRQAKSVVIFRRRRHSGPVFEARVPRSAKPETIEIHAPGYEMRSIMVVPNQDLDIPVKLEPVPEEDRERPRQRRPSRRRRRRPRKSTPDELLRELPNE
jgi:serine/threonine-protein kinase